MPVDGRQLPVDGLQGVQHPLSQPLAIRQWNDGMLRLAAARSLDLVRTARLLALAHVAGGDAMIACFGAKYHYWFWRPYQAIQAADSDGNPATVADPTWQPLGTTPNFPEYPSAHACHSAAVVRALDAFFGTDRLRVTLDSRAPGVTRRLSFRAPARQSLPSLSACDASTTRTSPARSSASAT